jgi:transposase
MSTLPLNTDITPSSPHAVQRTFINPSLWFDDCDGFRVFFCRHEILYRVALHDSAHLKIVAVTLRQSRLATQQDIATAFGHTVATQRRWEKLYAQLGSAAFTPKPHTGRRPSVDVAQHAVVRRWFLEQLSTAEIARRLCVDEATVRRLLRRLGLSRSKPLFNKSTIVSPGTNH